MIKMNMEYRKQLITRIALAIFVTATGIILIATTINAGSGAMTDCQAQVTKMRDREKAVRKRQLSQIEAQRQNAENDNRKCRDSVEKMRRNGRNPPNVVRKLEALCRKREQDDDEKHKRKIEKEEERHQKEESRIEEYRRNCSSR